MTADFGNYGPFFIRMAWHGAGTYRIFDGRGGASGAQQRFEPLNSLADNVNLDKARRLLWPVKKKYGRKLSWGDLMVLTGNVSLETMGFKTFGYAGGRADDWQSDLVYWGGGAKFMSDNRSTSGKLEKPLAATQMGLIYVNPEGPNGNPDPYCGSKRHSRSLWSHGYERRRDCGAHRRRSHVRQVSWRYHNIQSWTAPAGAGIEQQGLGWVNKHGTGNGDDTLTSGLEGAWSPSPVYFTMQYLNNLLNIDWVQTKSPAGATQWTPKDPTAVKPVPDAHDPSKSHPPMMFTTDLSLKFDPEYSKIVKRFQQNPEEFKLAFAKAWFKLVHRDMGPRSRYLGSEVPKEELIWQDPIPAVDYKLIDDADASALKAKILASGLTEHELVRAAWASAATFRGTDKRGGANGARIRLAPEKSWAVNDPDDLAKVLTSLQSIQTDFNSQHSDGKKVSLADLIVLGGSAAVEDAAKKAGYDVKVPFSPGRADATQEQTDVTSMAVLEPTADGFRNYFSKSNQKSPPELLVERASF